MNLAQIIVNMKLLFQSDSLAESDPAPKDMTAVNPVSHIVLSWPALLYKMFNLVLLIMEMSPEIIGKTAVELKSIYKLRGQF